MLKLFKRKPKDKPISQGKALILAREILGPNVMLSRNPEEGDCEIFLHPAWQATKKFSQRFHPRGFDKRNDFVEEFIHKEEVIEEGYVLIACGQDWKETLEMARKHVEYKTLPELVEEANEKEKEIEVNA